MNDYELVVAGLARLLARFPDRLRVCERLVVGQPIDRPVDVALYDTYGRVGSAGPALRALAEMPTVGHLAVFSFDFGEDLLVGGRAAGVTGFISKALSGDEIADAIVRVASGDDVVVAAPSPATRMAQRDWPGEREGITERESEVLVLAAEGLSNREIGAALFVSLETVKGHMRQIFSKLGLRNRVQATNYVHRSVHRLAADPLERDGPTA